MDGCPVCGSCVTTPHASCMPYLLADRLRYARLACHSRHLRLRQKVSCYYSIRYRSTAFHLHIYWPLLGVHIVVRAVATWLAINAAVAPAPIPLSMLTTVSPGAHVWSIESSAARPLPPAP